MAAFDRSIQLDPELRELIKIRVSQLNGCAFCLDLHITDSRDFPARERAALALTEAMIRLTDGPVSDAV